MSEYHVPVLLQTCIEGLNINPEGTYVDVTFGGGGHSREIVSHLTTGKLYGFDQDEDAEQNITLDPHFVFVRSNFRYLSNFLRYHEVIRLMAYWPILEFLHTILMILKEVFPSALKKECWICV